MNRYELLERYVLWEGKFLRGVKIAYRDAEGSVREWETTERVNCSGVVAVVPITDSGELVLIRQYRPAVGNVVVEFPAGLNDKGERLEQAARRELLEETGYEPRRLTLLAHGPLSSGSSSELLTVYLAEGLEYRGIGERDETEDIEVLKAPLVHLYEYLSAREREGNYIDLKIYGFVELAKRKRLRG